MTEILLVAFFTAIACALAGFFLVLRRQAMIADAIGHAVLPGLVAAYALAGLNPLVSFVGAVAAALLTVGLVEALIRSKRLKDDSAIGLVFPTLFAIGVFFVSVFFRGAHLDADAVLFGEIVMTPLERFYLMGRDLGPQAAWLAIAIIAAATILLISAWRPLTAATFDQESAKAMGLRPSLAQWLLMTLVACASVAAFRSVGAILATALIVVPTVIAQLLSRKLAGVLLVSLGAAALASLGGSAAAIQLDIPVSGTIAFCLGILLFITSLFSPQRGLVLQALKRRQQKEQFGAEMLLIHLLTHQDMPEAPFENRLQHLIEELGWSPQSAWAALKHSQGLGWVVDSESGTLTLTEKGLTAARDVIQRRSAVPRKSGESDSAGLQT